MVWVSVVLPDFSVKTCSADVSPPVQSSSNFSREPMRARYPDQEGYVERDDVRSAIIELKNALQDLAAGLKDPSRWLIMSGNYEGQRFSPLTQITPENVKNLTVAWKVHTGDKSTGSGLVRVSGSHVGEPSSGPGKTPATVWSATPLFVNDTLYLGFLALAAGSILYVVIELLGVCRRLGHKTVVGWGLTLGLMLGFATDFVLVAAGA